MNTPRSPREILLARHSAARSALDAQRDILLTRFAADTPVSPSRSAATFSPLAWFAVLGRELVAPYRRTWTALACVWATLLGIQQLDHLSTTPGLPDLPASRADSALLVLWLEQRRFLADLDARPSGPPGKTSATSIAFPFEEAPPAPVPPPLGQFAPVKSPVAFT